MAGTNFKVKNGLEITSGTLVVSNGVGTNGQVLKSTGTGVEWGTASSGSGTVTSVAATVPSLLSISGSPITTSGTLAITYSGTALPVANGGTGLTTLTAGYIPYGAGTSAFGSSANLFWDSANSRLGIGTTSPTSKLNVLDGDVRITASGLGNTLFSFNGTTANITVNSSSAPLVFSTNSTEQMRITSAGNLGLGTASPAYKLDVNGTLNASGAITQAGSQVLTAGNYTTYVGNGTLTLAVSGTGLTGSASFTANQSGNSTFTVTSNATNANTASTIVARDASGNFSAGTITASLTGNASGSSGSCTGNSATATSAATLTTARTINTTSFNGSADITIGSKSNIGTPASPGTNYYGTIYVTQTASPTGGSTGDLYLVF